MKKFALLAPLALGIGLLATPSTATAGEKFRFHIGSHGWGFGIDIGHGHRGHRKHRYHHRARHHHHRHRDRHVCVRVPHYNKIWVPPRYEKIHYGYDHCGRPIYRSVVVRHGYWRRAIDYYHCSGCGRRY